MLVVVVKLLKIRKRTLSWFLTPSIENMGFKYVLVNDECAVKGWKHAPLYTAGGGGE
jgi:hypothetical protein